MKRAGRRVLIIVGIVAVFLIIATVVLRIVFTRERLIAIILPRAERALHADIEVEDVSVRFPFGFGVGIENLKFVKQLEDGKDIRFFAEKVEVKASLVSLIKRRPRLSAVNVFEGTVESGSKEGGLVEIKGIDSGMSLAPGKDGWYRTDLSLKADSLLFVQRGSSKRRGAAGISLEGVVNTLLPLESTKKEIFPETAFDGEIRLSKAVFSNKWLPAEIVIAGVIGLKGNEAYSEKMKISSRYTDMTLSFKVVFDDGRRPRYFEFEDAGGLDLKDAAEFIKESGATAEGRVEYTLKGAGRITPIVEYARKVSAGGLSSEDKPLPEDFSIEGSLKVEESMIQRREPPLTISKLDLEADISGSDVKRINATFDFDGSPFTLKGSSVNSLPAALEVASIYGRGGFDDVSPGRFGLIFDKLKVDARTSLEIHGRLIDAGKFLAEKGAESEQQEGRSAGSLKTGSAPGLLFANPFTIMALRHSDLSIRIDSLISPYADMSSLKAKVEARNGVLRVYPVTADYAGGKIQSAASFDLTDLEQINASANFSAEKVNAGMVISKFTEAGDIFKGVLDLNGTGRVNIAPGVDPLKSLHARYSVNAKNGVVDFSKYLSPLSASTGLDLSRYESYSYETWTGNFMVSAGKIIIDEWKMSAASGSILASGAIGVDGALDCRANLIIPPETQRTMKDLKKYRDLADLFRDNSGNLVFSFDIGGTAKSPKVVLDRSGAKKKAEDKLIGELKKKASEKLKDLFK